MVGYTLHRLNKEKNHKLRQTIFSTDTQKRQEKRLGVRGRLASSQTIQGGSKRSGEHLQGGYSTNDDRRDRRDQNAFGDDLGPVSPIRTE